MLVPKQPLCNRQSRPKAHCRKQWVPRLKGRVGDCDGEDLIRVNDLIDEQRVRALQALLAKVQGQE
jgi:hypothetical protein